MPPNVSEDWHLKRVVVGIFGLLFADGGGHARAIGELQSAAWGRRRTAVNPYDRRQRNAVRQDCAGRSLAPRRPATHFSFVCVPRRLPPDNKTASYPPRPQDRIADTNDSVQTQKGPPLKGRSSKISSIRPIPHVRTSCVSGCELPYRHRTSVCANLRAGRS